MMLLCSTSTKPRAPRVRFWQSVCAHARLWAFPLFPPFLHDGTLLINWSGYVGLPLTLTSKHFIANLPPRCRPSRLNLPIYWGCIRVCRQQFNTTIITFTPEVLWCALEWGSKGRTFKHGAVGLLMVVPSGSAST